MSISFKNTSKIPEIFLIGVPKAGTSSIASALSESGIYNIGKYKEPKFFTISNNAYRLQEKNDKTYYRDKPSKLQDYVDCYTSDQNSLEERLKIDCSTDYFKYCDKAIPNILSLTNNPRFIVVLRNPIERAFSQYCDTKQQGRESLGFLEALAEEESRMEKGWGPAFHYLNDSYYSSSINWFRSNSIDLEIYVFEEIFASGESFSKFMSAVFNVVLHRNKSFNINQSISPKPIIFDAAKFIWNKAPRKFSENEAAVSFKNHFRSFLSNPKPNMTREERSHLRNIFAEEIQEITKIMGRPLTNWN